LLIFCVRPFPNQDKIKHEGSKRPHFFRCKKRSFLHLKKWFSFSSLEHKLIDKFRAVVAGHICLDMIPNLEHLKPGQFSEMFKPGRLIVAGAVTFAPGGPVPNTGVAMHRLGVPVDLIARVGADPFGQIVRDIIAAQGPRLAQGITADERSATSYTVIICPPAMDRFFLHCPGTNDIFCAEDIDYRLVAQAGIFHFGYPPIMRRMYMEGGAGLEQVYRRAKATGVTTSLDMTMPDPSSPGGLADWPAILGRVLPYVDIFAPSIEELLFMLRRKTYDDLSHSQGESGAGLLDQVTPELLSDVSGELLRLGVKMALIKLGERGLYLRTAGVERLSHMGRGAPADLAAWANLELWAPCFQVEVMGTTGAGFLSGLLRDVTPLQAMAAAVGVGACDVEAADATSGIRAWEDTLQRIASGWPQHALALDSPGWTRDDASGVWRLKASHF
jgi:sugar/nucleoside kinase (ribokinase family)